jgi:hypothetical protein
VPKRDIPRVIALCQRGMSPVHKLLSEPEKKSNLKMNALSNHSAIFRGFAGGGLSFSNAQDVLHLTISIRTSTAWPTGLFRARDSARTADPGA